MTELLQIVIRSIIAVLTLHVFARMVGKQQIGQLTFFDYISGITVGSIAADLATNLDDRPLALWSGLLTWMLLIIAFQYLSLKNRQLHKLLDGEPVVVVQNGKILERNLALTKLPVDTLMSELRAKGIFDLSELEFALLETDGQLSVLKKSQYMPVTPHDLQLNTEYKGLSTELIVDGVVIYQNLSDVSKDYTWLMQELNKQGISKVEEVFYAALSPAGTLFVDKYQDDLAKPQQTDVSDYPGPN